MISTHNPNTSYLEKTWNSPINPTKMNKLIAWGRKNKALFYFLHELKMNKSVQVKICKVGM